MKIALKAFLCLTFSFLFCFMCVGYAELTTTLSISGTAEVTPPEGVYIYAVESVGFTGSLDSATHTGTVLNSTVSLEAGASGYTILKISVRNNSSDIYGYAGAIRQSGINDATYSNGDIVYAVYSDSSCNFSLAKGTVLNANDTMDFYVKFYYADNASIDSAGESLTSVINFKFETPPPTYSGTSSVISGALEKFRQILNTTSDYSTLTSEMIENYDKTRDWTASYIGNVVGSSDDDSQTLETLFAGELTLNVDGVDQNITVIVKRENIDGNTSTGDSYSLTNSSGTTNTYSGCEMTLYMTTQSLENPNGQWNVYDSPIYAAVFTKDSSGGEWYQLGDIYAGQAQVVGYTGGYTGGSFDTGTWKSTESYYNTGVGAGIGTIVTKRYTDKSELASLVSQANALSQSEYTPESWANFRSALTPAVEANNSRTVTQVMVITRARALKAALAALESQTQ